MERIRERRRRELDDRIVAVAEQQIATVGGPGLSLRAVAREVGVTVSALYRYYPSRDDLLTELLTRTFRDQADAVITAASSEPDPASALATAMRAYRQWALAHPHRFELAYGTPIPGYEAPPERTVIEGARLGDFLNGLVTQAWERGQVGEESIALRGRLLDDQTAAEFAGLARRRGYSMPLPVLAATLDAFVRIHGFTVMEVFGQLRPLAADASSWFEETLADALSGLGLPQTAAPRNTAG